MRKSPLIELLQAFTPEERAEFRFFVNSPYFNRGEFRDEAPLLLHFLYGTAPDWSWGEGTRRAAYPAVFPDAAFVEGKLEKVMSVLHRLARIFVSVHASAGEKGEFQRHLDLAAFSRQRGLANRFENVMQHLRKDFGAAGSGEDFTFFSRQMQLALEQHEYENLFNQKRGDLHIPHAIGALDLYYHAIRMNLLNRFLMQQKVTHLDMSGEMRLALTETRLPGRLIEKSAFLRLTQAFIQVLQLDRPDQHDFHALVALTRELEGKIQTELLKDYYSFLRSCCSIMVNSGQLDYLPILFQLQKEHLERGFFYYDQKISASMFQSIVSVALRLKEFAWVYDCIQAHSDRIVGDNADRDYYKLNLANYFFHTGHFDAALETLPQSLAEIGYQMMARRLELKIYYSQDSDLLQYKIDAFKMYLSRSFLKPLSLILKESNGNFVNLLLQLSNTRKGDQARVQRLSARIQAKTWVYERDWLLEKANELL